MSVNVGFYKGIIETCFPDLRVTHIRFVGGGTCRVFAVNHALIFRFPHGDGSVAGENPSEAEGAFLFHEKRVYAALAPLLPLPIPRYRYFSTGCAQFPYPVAGYEKLPGRSLSACQLNSQELAGVARQIGEFLSALHAIPLTVLPAELQPPSPASLGRSNARSLFREVEARAFPLLNAAEQAWTSRLFQELYSNHTLWKLTPVFTHGDFDGSNILYAASQGIVSGIIDFEEAGQNGDPAADFCALLAGFGTAFLEAVLAAYTLDVSAAMRRRIDLHAKRILFIELLYGIQTNDRRFIDNARQRLHRARHDLDPIGDWLDVSTSETR
ncbi:MAG: phosphotransferase [Chloroflexota bacterium]|nr:phosphotransferase [Chloroflexota bacterium]MDE2931433.1 phosphotransferase [Chloroflexota bacterium]